MNKDRRDQEETVRRTVARIWERARPEVIAELEVVEEATARLLSGDLPDDLRRAATTSAHKLGGSLGTFGWPEGSLAAMEIEQTLGEDTLDPSRAVRLSDLALRIRRLLEGGRPPGTIDESPAGITCLVLLSSDVSLANALQEHAEPDLTLAVGFTVLEARSLVKDRDCEIVVVDLPGATDRQEAMALVEELSVDPFLSVFVLTDAEDTIDRVDIVRRGARGAFDRSMNPKCILDGVREMVATARREGIATVLVVDDDLVTLGTVKALLEVEGLKVHTTSDPLSFWEVLERVGPDLLVLDVDMPGLSGLELCRVVRSHQRWRVLPILFLTARREKEMVRALFEAGADDYVPKDLMGPEIVMRVKSRLERARLTRSLAENDPLTSVANRARAAEMLDKYLRLAARFEQPLSLGIIDLDRLKTVNERHGHAAGDQVLARLGELLQVHFRGEDVIGRWAGDEFCVGMYGMGVGDGSRRIEDALRLFAEIEFEGMEGDLFRVSFSAGVAEFPRDGSDLRDLYRQADRALQAAKEDAGGRVHSAGSAG